MREFGYKRIEVWLDKTEAEVIKRYCFLSRKAVATFMRRLAFDLAAKELPELEKRYRPAGRKGGDA